MPSKKIPGVNRRDLFFAPHHRVRIVDGFNPRTIFNKKTHLELVESFREEGCHSPILVRPDRMAVTVGGVPFLLIAGERRWRAAEALSEEGIEIQLPIRVLHVNEEKALAIAASENIQRDDLTLRDMATTVARLINYGNSNAEVGKALGKPTSWITQMVHVLTLPTKVQKHIDAGHLTLSAGVALSRGVSSEEQTAIVEKAIKASKGNRSRASKTVLRAAGKTMRPGKKDVQKMLNAIERFVEVRPGENDEEQLVPITTATDLVLKTLSYSVGGMTAVDFADLLCEDLFLGSDSNLIENEDATDDA